MYASASSTFYDQMYHGSGPWGTCQLPMPTMPDPRRSPGRSPTNCGSPNGRPDTDHTRGSSSRTVCQGQGRYLKECRATRRRCTSLSSRPYIIHPLIKPPAERILEDRELGPVRRVIFRSAAHFSRRPISPPLVELPQNPHGGVI
jgi:hypothetical protein